MSPRLRLAAAALCMALVATACGERSLSVGNWRVVWDDTVERIDSLESADIPTQACQEMVAFLREQRDRLTPVPLDALAEPVGDWFDAAQNMFFECPPDAQDGRGWAGAFELLDTREAAVESVLP